MPNTTTPNAYRSNSTPDQLVRQVADTELWDDLGNVVFTAVDEAADAVAIGATLAVCSLTVGTPVDCRLEVHAQAMGYSLGPGTCMWDAYVRLAAVNTIWSEYQRWPAGVMSTTISWQGTIDVAAGSHSLDILLRVDATSATALDFFAKRLVVRRGRPPASV